MIAVIGAIIGSQVAQLTRRAPEYAETIEKKISNLQESALDEMSGILEHLGYDVKPQQTATPPA